jgi:hypothetical protein
MRNFMLQVTLLALVGCADTKSFEPYYADRSDPDVTGVDPAFEEGNGGGNHVTINGSGFGNDLDDIVVQFGRHNAELVSVTDSAIEVVTPTGPITGGAVDILVATPTGYIECIPEGTSGFDSGCEVDYTYDVGTLVEESDFSYTGQEHFLLIHNLWYSCYGGMYQQPQIGGCEDIAYFGQTGLDGIGEFYRFSYPRVHTASQGFVSGTDFHPDAWRVVEQFDQPFPSGIDDLRERVGNFKLVNEYLEGDGDQYYCADLSLPPEDNESRTCAGVDIRRYDRTQLRFCEGRDAEEGFNYSYAADWPVKENFFVGEDDGLGSSDILLDITDPQAQTDLGLSDYPLTVPPPMIVRAESGFTDEDAWAVSNLVDCGDEDGDGEAWLDEDGIVFSWEPIPDDLLAPDDDRLDAVDTYVHVSVSLLNVGWFLGDGWGLRASVVVPDDHGFDADTGRSYLGVPNEVLYQFPTPNSQWSSENVTLRIGNLGTFEDNASFMLIEVLRVTDYRIETNAGPLVVSYLTGDMTFPEWNNPIEDGEDCSDCLDFDEDGWTDFRDPDCNSGLGGSGTEENATSSYTCNDGLDNDGDGDIDAEDVKCERGWDAESNCDDGIDNDDDGWVDDLDGECPDGDPFAQEAGTDTWTCSDGIDNDADGWIDSGDPACTKGDDDEVGGFLGTACNDGDDDDGNFDIDSEDLYCFVVGAEADTESPPSYGTRCSDGVDNTDSDGFVDALDPDCEIPPHNLEDRDFLEPSEYPMVTECYDGVDNDEDGRTDAADPNCWNSALTFAPDGFLPSESVVRADQDETGCNDGLDTDGDGWIDGKDPDCLPDQADQSETGGTNDAYACNDGDDNDGDGLIDAEDVLYCQDGFGNFEGP